MPNFVPICQPLSILVRRRFARNFSNLGKYPSKYDAYLNELTKNRDPAGSVLGVLFDTKYTEAPDLIYFAGGLPNPYLFPFEQASFRLKNNQVINIDKELMLKALQYGCIEGYGPLVQKFKSYMERFHNVTDWQANDLVVCAGLTDSLSRCLEMVLGEDVYFLAEDPLFGSVADYVNSYQSRYIGIEGDELGMNPHSLREAVLNIRDEESNHRKMVLYLNYMTVTRNSREKLLERLQKIYKIAQEFDILIIEIDPHFLLHAKKENDKDFPSLLRLDTDERVLRCDSASILFGPGLRVGTVTGPRHLVRLVCSHIDGSMLHASQLSQVLVSKTIDDCEEEALQQFSDSIYKNFIMERRNLEKAANAFLGKLKWKLYPEYPFLSLKVEKSEKSTALLSYLQNQENQFKFAVSPSVYLSEGSQVTLGLSFAGTSAEQMEKVISYLGEDVLHDIRVPNSSPKVAKDLKPNIQESQNR